MYDDFSKIAGFLLLSPLVAADTLAEWLRRRPAKPVGSAREGSNPSGVAF